MFAMRALNDLNTLDILNILDIINALNDLNALSDLDQILRTTLFCLKRKNKHFNIAPNAFQHCAYADFFAPLNCPF